MRIHFILTFSAALLAVSTLAFADDKVNKKPLTCEVVILGGGAGGLHTAFRLAPTMGDKVCLFEKQNRLGGRIYDVSRTPGGPVFGLGALRIPVMVYAVTILLMVWLAWGRSWALLTPGSMLAAMGATLFMASDAILALDRFHRSIRQAQSLIMTSYVTAQALIALSVGAR